MPPFSVAACCEGLEGKSTFGKVPFLSLFYTTLYLSSQYKKSIVLNKHCPYSGSAQAKNSSPMKIVSSPPNSPNRAFPSYTRNGNACLIALP